MENEQPGMGVMSRRESGESTPGEERSAMVALTTGGDDAKCQSRVAIVVARGNSGNGNTDGGNRCHCGSGEQRRRTTAVDVRSETSDHAARPFVTVEGIIAAMLVCCSYHFGKALRCLWTVQKSWDLDAWSWRSRV